MNKKIFIRLISIIICIAFNLNLFSQGTSDDLDIDALMNEIDTKTENKVKESTVNKDFKLSLSGDHGFNFHIPVIPKHIDFHGNIKAPRFTNEMGIEFNYKFVTLKSYWDLDLIVTDTGQIEDIIKVRPMENSLTLSPWKFNISLGYLYHTWGVADEINPTDNINPMDFSVGAEKEKMSILSAKVEFFPVRFMSLEMIYVPFMENNIYPIDYVAELKDELEINDVSILNPDFDPSTFSLGGKINFYFQYADFSLSYLTATDPYYTPQIKLSPVKSGPFTLLYTIDSITLRKNRLHHFGADVKTNIDRFGIWLEGCYTMSEDFLLKRLDIKNHKLSWTLGFDFNYGPDQMFYMNFQYFGNFVPLYDYQLSADYDESKLGNEELPYETGKDEDYYEEYYFRVLTEYVGGHTNGLEMGISFTMQFPFNIGHFSFEPSLSAMYLLPIIYDRDEKIRYGNLFIKPEFIFTPIDALDFIIGVDLYYSWRQEKDESHIEIDDMSELGIFHYDSNIYIAINYKWGFDFYK